MTPEDAKRLGGSDQASVLGISPWQGKLGLFLRCTRGVHQPTTPEMQRGTDLQETVGVAYSEVTGLPIVNGRQLPGLPGWARASLDATVEGGPDGRGVLEFKTCTLDALDKHWGPPGTDLVPAHYAAQGQWYAGWGLHTGVADAGWCDVAVLAAPESTLQALAGWAKAAGGVVPPESVLALPGVQFRTYRLTLDLEVFRWEVEASERFWTDHILTGKPPEDAPLLAGDVRAVEALAKATPGGEPLRWEALGAPERELVARWVGANQARKEVEDVESALGTRLRLLLAGASGVVGLPADLGQRIDHRHQKDGKRPLILRGGAT